jgi:hypothetical protein
MNDTPEAMRDAEATRNVLVVIEEHKTVYELDADHLVLLAERGAWSLVSELDGEDLQPYADRNNGAPHDADRDCYIAPFREVGWMLDRPPVPADAPTQLINQARAHVSKAAGLLGRARYLEGDVEVVDASIRDLNAVDDRLRIDQNQKPTNDGETR